MALKNFQLSYFGSVSVYSVNGIEAKHRKDSFTRGSFFRHVNADLGRSLSAHTGVVGQLNGKCYNICILPTQSEAVVQFHEHALC